MSMQRLQLKSEGMRKKKKTGEKMDDLIMSLEYNRFQMSYATAINQSNLFSCRLLCVFFFLSLAVFYFHSQFSSTFVFSPFVYASL